MSKEGNEAKQHQSLHRSDSRHDENRNFRSAYYEKVGFRGVEERKMLKLIFSDKPIDLPRLTSFAQRFTLPTDYRLIVWKYLLGVLPNDVDEETETIVQNEQSLTCHYLRSSLDFLLLSTQLSDPNKATVFALMYLLENGRLSIQIQYQLDSKEMKSLIAMASIFEFEDVKFEDEYFLFRNFCKQEEKLRHLYLTMVEKVQNELDDPELEHYLFNHPVNDVISIWFSTLFSGILHRDSLVKIVEKVIVGCHKILVLTAKRIFIALKPHLLPITSNDELRTKLLTPLNSNISEHIIGKVLDQI